MGRKCKNKKIKKLLNAYHLGILSPKEKEEVEIHLIECEWCRNELDSAEKFSNFLHKNRDFILSELKRREESKRRIFGLDYSFAKKVLVSATLLLASIVVICVYYFTSFKKPEIGKPLTYQETRGEYIKVLKPYGEISQKPRFIKWSEIPGADYYLVNLEDSNKEVLWSALSHETEIRIPPFILRKINKGERYFIIVKAFSSEGRIILKSKKVEFSVSY